MKSNFVYIFLVSFLLLCFPYKNFASHGTGGELTWKCLGTGQYVFQAKFYRDCNGIPGPASININTTVPGIPFLTTTLISQTDISPTGFYSNGSTSCPTCIQGAIPPVFGIIEEFIYETAPVTLSGIPPPSGWTFSWGECCRSSAVSNISNAGSVGFLLQAKMYSYNGQNADPCFDASPYFAEKPSVTVCTGLPIVYQHLSADPELDSLNYSFDYALSDAGDTIPFAPGFSVQDPLPDPIILNNQTGEYAFTSTTGGYYVMVIKVSAYKCGILVSEIRREINVLIENNCPPVSGMINLPPDVSAPFTDPVTGLMTSYSDTVFAGDTVTFMFNSTDFQLFNNSSAQLITSSAFGQQYGTGFSDPLSGCLIPPCATLSPTSPFTSPIGFSQSFNWNTTPAHLGYSFSCVQFSNTYYFLNKVQDNYCPANASSTRVFSITVLPTIPQPPVINNGGTLECNLGSSYVYQWFFNRFAIPGATSFSYTPLQTGNYQVLAVAPDGQGNYSDGYFFIALGVSESNLLNTISILPNPSVDGIFQIKSDVKDHSQVSIYVSDILGKEILTDNTVFNNNSTYVLDLSKNNSGVYLVQVTSNGIVRYFKVVK